jgi:hypothetical protein
MAANSASYRKLPKAIVAAIAMYYANCGLAEATKPAMHSRTVVCQQPLQTKRAKWNKHKDLEDISSAAGKYGYSFEACSGTFWFYRKGRLGHLVVDNVSFPLARIVRGGPCG